MRASSTRSWSILLLCLIAGLPAFAHPHDGLEWAISDGSDRTMAATSRDGHRAVERYEAELDVPFIWLRQDGREYLITDAATVKKARSIFEDLKEIRDLEIEIEIDSEELERAIEEELEVEMEEFERRMAGIEERLENGSFAALAEMGDAVAEIDLEEIEEIAELVRVNTRHIEARASEIEAWADDLQTRIEQEAIPLFEDAIRSGIAKPAPRP